LKAKNENFEQKKRKESERAKTHLKEAEKKRICWPFWCENELMLQKFFC
jgi:hypothetical protein